MSDPWRTSVHEAGHCCAACLLHATRGAGPVTIDGGAGCHRFAIFGSAPKPAEADWKRLGQPWPLVPARVKRFYESLVMCWLAGAIAEDLHTSRDAPVPGVPAIPAPAVVLPHRERVMFEAAAAQDDHLSDTAKAADVMTVLSFSDLALADKHLAFLAHETQVVLAGAKAKRMVLGLAQELMLHKTLPARRWRQILARLA